MLALKMQKWDLEPRNALGLQELGNERKQILPQSHQKKFTLADTLVLAWWDPF